MARRYPRMTPALFHVMLALAERPLHGYALLAAVSDRTGGRVELGPSSLYYTLGRLEEAGLIREADPPPGSDEPHEGQRRYYDLTPQGRRHVRSELGLLGGILDHARAVGLDPREGR